MTTTELLTLDADQILTESGSHIEGLAGALACGIRIAETTAQFGLSEVGLGILPSSGGFTRLVRAAGPAVARDVVLFGDRFPAQNACRLDLIREVVDVGQALPTALDRVAYLAKQPPMAAAWTKAAIDAAAELSVATSLLIEQLAYAVLNRAAHHGEARS